MKTKDLIGKRFGKLIVLSVENKTERNQYYVKCRCDCGQEKNILAYHLNNGASKSCGCGQGNKAGIPYNKKHGYAGNNTDTRTYRSWHTMKNRCSNPKSNRWKYYGGKGVKVCERWNDFSNFLADMKDRPEGMTLDRIDGNGDYTPENCKWSTPTEQRRNRSK